jgi:hypothetical protein
MPGSRAIVFRPDLAPGAAETGRRAELALAITDSSLP